MLKIDPKNLGGSSAASCVGVGWESGVALWERLRGDESRAKQWTREQRRMLDAGNALEPVAMQAVREDYGVEIVRPAEWMELRGHSDNRIVGHPDGWLEPGVVGAEIKTSGGHKAGWGEADTDQVPAAYQVQCMHYMALSGAKEWHLFALRVPTWSVTRYIIRRDDVVCAHLLEQERRMLRLVDEGTPPDPRDEAEARARWFQHTPGLSVEATPNIMAWVHKRAVAKRVEAFAGKVASEAALHILNYAKDAESIVSPEGDPICTLRSNRVFDREAFAAKHPEAYAECMDFVPALARERHKKLYESCMRDAANRDESARVIRTTPQLNKAIDLMLKGEAFQIPGVPEFAQLAGGDNG